MAGSNSGSTADISLAADVVSFNANMDKTSHSMARNFTTLK